MAPEKCQSILATRRTSAFIAQIRLVTIKDVSIKAGQTSALGTNVLSIQDTQKPFSVNTD